MATGPGVPEIPPSGPAGEMREGIESSQMRLFSLVLCVLVLTPTAVAWSRADEPVDFAREVRPVLSRACFACHGPDAKAREARLRLDARENAVGEDGSFAAIVPGDAAGSEVIFRITDAEDPMPPADSGFELSSGEIDVLRRWIDEGADYAQHWSFVPPVEPARPAIRDSAWARADLDRFVQAVLEERGLAPSPEADRRTLIRRVSLDLTGLPPSPEEVAAFLADDAPGAYERVVERLLASPRYGEHMARYWLDVARYGDTHGLHLDNYREMWPYRDRVIASFNENLAYDDFVVEQLAGDLLPEAGVDQIVASGFNRCNVTTNEGGSIEEEVYVRNVVDRVSTTSTAFLGLTLGCATCHDHKFDPVSQREFYSLFAFFNNIDGKPMDGNVKDHAPVLKVPSAEQARRLADLRGAMTEVEMRIEDAVAQIEYHERASDATAQLGEERELVWIEDELPAGAEVEGSSYEWVDGPKELVHSGERSMRRTSAGMQQHYFRDADRRLRIGAGDRLSAWVRLDSEDPPRELMLQFNGDGSQDWGHRAFWGEDLVNFGTSGTSSRLPMGELPAKGVWTQLEVAAEDVGLVEGDVVHGVAITQFDGTAWWDRVGIVTHTPQEPEGHVWVEDELPERAQPGGDGQTWSWVEEGAGPVHSGRRSLRRSGGDGLNQDFFTGAVPLVLRRGDRLFAHVWLDPEDPPRSIQLQFNDGSWDHRVRWGVEAHGAGRPDGADFVAGDLPETGRWHRLEASLEDVGLSGGAKLNGWAFTQVGGTVYWDSAGVRSWGRHDDRHLWSQRIWERRAPGQEGLAPEVLAAASLPEAERSAAQIELLHRYYLRHVWAGARDVMDPLEAELAQAEKSIAEAEGMIPTTLVMRERAEPRPAYQLERGEYDQRGEEVGRVTPAILPPMGDELPRDRLGLARWLVDPAHPLTARVTVNRFWQQLFGAGLVRTADDFGNQGTPPTHPELLDHLALGFVQDGWDVKGLMRRLVTSATYRQRSMATPEAVAQDPENRWLARGPRFRLDAEAIRDQALAVSGLLVEQLGGPSVKPPQPGGLWKVVGYTRSNTANFKADEGREKVHRRSLYTFIKRTAPAPQLSTFDAPNRESCSVRRERTNTPLQALLLLNDPQFLEAARHLAWRVMGEGGEAPAERAALAFELCTARPPDEAELEELLALYREQLRDYEADPEAAGALVAVGASPPPAEADPLELAAWMVVCNLILNLDEVLVKG